MEKQVKAHMEKVGQTQRDMLHLQDQFDTIQLDHQKRLGAERIATALCIWQRTRLHAAFGTMRSFLTLDRQREFLKEKHTMDMNDAAIIGTFKN